MSLERAELYAIGAAVIVGGVVLWKLGSTAKGLVTGDNALTRGATDAAGNPVSAYVGVPVLGTLGAAANWASGGYLASAGEWLGGTAADITTSDTGGVAPVSVQPSSSTDANGATVTGWEYQGGA